jgi:ribosome-associated protein
MIGGELAKLTKPKNARQLATLVAKICENKLAENTIVIDLTKIDTAPTDYFVLCSCNSQPQVGAIVDEIYKQCNELNISKPRSEGLEQKEWVLVDFFDVVAHIMLKQSRNYYKIEKLWADGAFYSIAETGRLKKINQKQILEMFLQMNGVS